MLKNIISNLHKSTVQPTLKNLLHCMNKKKLIHHYLFKFLKLTDFSS